MINLAYFIANDYSKSETFIKQLINDFSLHKEINLTVIIGTKNIVNTYNNLKCKTIRIPLYDYKLSLLFILNKVGNLFGNKGKKLQVIYLNQYYSKSLEALNGYKFDAVYIEYFSTAVNIYQYFKYRNIPIIIHGHGFDVTSMLNDDLYSKAIKKVFDYAHSIIVPSKALKRHIVIEGCNDEKINVVYPLPKTNYLPFNHSIKKVTRIIAIGRLTEKKNQLALIEMMKLLNDLPVNLQLIGEGPLEKEIISRIKKYNLQSRIMLLGAVDNKQAMNYLSSADIFVQNSITSKNGDREGFPVSICEAMQYSKPVVSTIHSGITENIINNESGIIVPENDYEAMANAIRTLIQNPEKQKQLGEGAQKRIKFLNERQGSRSELIFNIIKNATEN